MVRMVSVPLAGLKSMEFTIKAALQTKLSVADIILIITIIILALLSILWFQKQRNNKQVYIYKDSELVGVYSLAEPKEIVIDQHNTVRIQDKKVLMLSSDCPDKRCVKQGKTDAIPIICLPNRVVIEVKRDEKERSKFILY